MSNQENELITQILNGEGELYGTLIDRYKTGLYHHCFKIVHDEDIAEDIAQDSLYKPIKSSGTTTASTGLVPGSIK